MVFFDTGSFRHKFFFLIISIALCLTGPFPCEAMEGKQEEEGLGTKISKLFKTTVSKPTNYKYTFSNPKETEVSNNNNVPESTKGNVVITQKEGLSNNNNDSNLKSKSKQKQKSKLTEKKESPNHSDSKEVRLSSTTTLNLFCFDEIPNEILYLFFNWLPERERVIFGSCNKRLNYLYYGYEKRLLESPQAAENIFLPPDIPHQLKSSNKDKDIKKFVLFHKRYQQALLKMLRTHQTLKEYSSLYCEIRKPAREVSAPLEEIAPKSVTTAFLRYLTKVKDLRNAQEDLNYRNNFIDVLRKTYFNKKENSWEIKNDKDIPRLQEIIGLSTYFGLSLQGTFPQVSLPLSSITGRLLGSMQLREELKQVKDLKKRALEAAKKYNQLLSYNLFITIEDLWNAVDANIASKDEDPAFELIEDILRKTSSSENIRHALAALNKFKSQTSRKIINLKAKLYEQLLKGNDWELNDAEKAIFAYKALEDKEEDNKKKDIKQRIKELYDLMYTTNFNYLVSDEYRRERAIKTHMDDGDYKWVAHLWEEVLKKLQTGEKVQKGETKHYSMMSHELLRTDKNYFDKDEVIRKLIEIYETRGPIERLAQLWDELFDYHAGYYGNISSSDLIKAAEVHAKRGHLERSLELYKKALKRHVDVSDRIKIKKAIINIYLKLDKKEKVPAVCKGMLGLYSTYHHPHKELRTMKDVLEIYSKMEDKQRVNDIGYTIFETNFYMPVAEYLEKDVYVMDNFWKMGMKEETYKFCSNVFKKRYYEPEEKKWKILTPLYNRVFQDPTSTQADKDAIIGLYRELTPDAL